MERLVLLAIALGDPRRAILSPTGPPQVPSALRQARPSCRSGVLMIRCAYVDARAVVLLRCVLLLGFDVASAKLDRVELVLADAAVQNLLSTGEGVEAPLASLVHHGDRHGPVV